MTHSGKGTNARHWVCSKAGRRIKAHLSVRYQQQLWAVGILIPNLHKALTVVSHVMRHTLIILTTLIILCSCSAKNKQSSNSFKVILPDTGKTHKVYTTFEHLKLLDEQMGLEKIYNGIDSFEIRLWIVSMIKPNRMVLLKKSNQIITSQDFTYGYSSDNKLSFKAGKLIQNNSYSILVNSLKNHDFESLLSQDEIINFVDNVADGVTYTMEVATTKYYKLISYHCPEHYANTERNNRRFLNIVLLLDNYLHFYSPLCSP